MTRDRVGNARAGVYEAGQDETIQQALLGLPLGEVVALSACFPPLFTPRRFQYQKERSQFKPQDKQASTHISEVISETVRNTVFRELWLNDGGNFDNLGVEPLLERAHALKLEGDRPVLLVSDAGSDPLPNGRVNKFILPLTYLSLIFKESRRQRVELLRMMFREGLLEGAYIGIGNRLTSREGSFLNAAGHEAFRFEDKEVGQIAGIRTDLAPMSCAEAAALITQGYLCASVQLRKLEIDDTCTKVASPADVLKRFGMPNATTYSRERLISGITRI
jgi:hypothetical protein